MRIWLTAGNLLYGPVSSLEGSDLDGFGWNVAKVGGAIMGDAGGSLLLARGVDAYLLEVPPTVFFFESTPLGGGAIRAASGSLLAGAVGAGVDGVSSVVLGMMGGGARGLAASTGSSPGKIQRFSFSS